MKARRSGKPWALFVSFVRPHFPLTAPPEFYKLYPPERMPMPRLYDEARSSEPSGDSGAQIGDELRRLFRRRGGRSGARSPPTMRSSASSTTTSARSSRRSKRRGSPNRRASSTPLTTATTSAARGLWGKSVMYEESAAIPMIVAGRGVAPGAVSTRRCRWSTATERVSKPSAARFPQRTGRGHRNRCGRSLRAPSPTAMCCRSITPSPRSREPS